MCGRHVQPLMLRIAIYIFERILVETEQDILGIDKRDDTVEVDRTTQAIVDPEEGSEIARVGETGRLEEDVVEGASARHEGFDSVDAGVFDGAADAAVGQLEPFLRFLAVLGDCEGFFDIGGCTED